MGMLLLGLTALFSGTGDLDAIGKEVSQVWRGDGPAAKLRVRCRFEMKVERADEALGDRYFPNTILEGGPAVHARGRAKPQTIWIEDVAVRGVRYRNDYEFLGADGKSPPGWNLQNVFNGKNSWSRDVGGGAAMRYAGAHLTTRLTLGYYQDMIGFPLKPLGEARTTAGDIG